MNMQADKNLDRVVRGWTIKYDAFVLHFVGVNDMNAQNVREGKSLRIILLLVPLVILAFIALAGPHVFSQTGPNIATGRFLRAADGTDLFLHTVSPRGETEVLLLQDLEGDENAYDSLSDGDLIRIGYAVIRYDDSGQGSVAPYEWELKQEGTPEDVPAGVYAEIQARFPGRA